MHDQSCLAGPDLTGNDREAGMIENPIFEHGERHGVLAAPIQEIRVWHDREGLCPQPVEPLVHQTLDGRIHPNLDKVYMSPTGSFLKSVALHRPRSRAT